MKIELRPEKCIACGLCHIEAPKIFDYTDEGIVQFYPQVKRDPANDCLGELPSEQEQAVISAVKKCPTKALVARFNN